MHEQYFGRVILVGLGGFLGASARFVVGDLVHRFLPGATFPIATFLVNVAGCLAIGFFSGLMDLRQTLGPAQRLFLLVGVLGGFTTFSTFAFESLDLAQASQLGRAAVNVVGQIVFGLVAAWVGFRGAQSW